MDVAPRPDVDALAFNVSGWQERERSPGWIVWTNEAGDALSAAVAPRRGFPSLSDREALTKYGRTFAESQGGSIVSMDTFLEGTVELAQCVYKRQRGSGYAYTAMIWVPLRNAVHVVTLFCGEGRMTGVREAVVAAKLAEEGELELEGFQHQDEKGAVGQVKGWFQDPYEVNYPGPVLRSIADDETYDAMFPDHPLSRMRRSLSILRPSLRLTA